MRDSDVRVRSAIGATPAIDHGASAAEVRLELDLDVAEIASRRRLGPDHVRDGDGVVDRRPVPAVGRTVVATEEGVQLGHERPDPSRGAEPFLDAGPEDAPCASRRARPSSRRGRSRRRVRAASGSHQMLNSAAGVKLPSAIEPPISTMRADSRRFHAARDSGATFVSGPVGTSVTAASARRTQSAMNVDSVGRGHLAARQRKHGAVETALAVHVRGDDELAGEWTIGARRDRDVGSARELQYTKRVPRGLLQCLVPVGRGDPEELHLRARERQQERDRVVVPGIAVEDDRNLRRHARTLGTAVYRPSPMADVREKVRAFALSLPETSEEHPWGEDVAKVRGKIFVFLGTASSGRITVKLDESHAHALSIEGAEPTGYGLGKSGWVTLPRRAKGVSIGLLRDWVEESYRIVAPKRLVDELDARVATPPTK